MSVRTEAIVLRRTNYGEADRILQLLTPLHGKMSVMAKGVRREKSKLAGGIELFATTEVVIHEGRGELGILTSSRLLHFFSHILDSYEKMQFGYDVIKRVSKASEMLPEPEWYHLAKGAFESLNNPLIPLGVIELWFLLQHSTLLGQGLNIASDVHGAPLQSSEVYLYDAHEMGFKINKNGDVTSDHIKLLRLASAKQPAVVAQVGGIEPLLPVCLAIARTHAQ